MLMIIGSDFYYHLQPLALEQRMLQCSKHGMI